MPEVTFGASAPPRARRADRFSNRAVLECPVRALSCAPETAEKQVARDSTDGRRAKPRARPLTQRAHVDAARVTTPRADEGWDLDPAESNAEYAELVRRQLTLLGEDPDREGLQKTPVRVANAMAWLTRGYAERVEDVVGDALFEEEHRNMVMVRDIELYSLCEHHLLPFFGKAHVAYIPAGRIVGLSKIPRIVETFARRLQVQERLTEEIAGAVESVLQPAGVGVVIEAYHLCMMMRGVEKQNSKTITSAVRGAFRDDARTRAEFLYLAHGREIAL
jgi:GTP cyclohydrolase I